MVHCPITGSARQGDQRQWKPTTCPDRVAGDQPASPFEELYLKFDGEFIVVISQPGLHWGKLSTLGVWLGRLDEPGSAAVSHPVAATGLGAQYEQDDTMAKDPLAENRLQLAAEAIGGIRELADLLAKHRGRIVHEARQYARKLQKHLVAIDPAFLIRDRKTIDADGVIRYRPTPADRISGRRVSDKVEPATNEDFLKQASADHKKAVAIQSEIEKKAKRSKKKIKVPTLLEIKAEMNKDTSWQTTRTDAFEALEEDERELSQWCESGQKVMKTLLMREEVEDDTIASLNDIADNLEAVPGVPTTDGANDRAGEPTQVQSGEKKSEGRSTQNGQSASGPTTVEYPPKERWFPRKWLHARGVTDDQIDHAIKDGKLHPKGRRKTYRFAYSEAKELWPEVQL